MTPQRIFEGPSAWADFSALLSARNTRRAFLVCGDTTWEKSGAAGRINALRAVGAEFRRFAAFEPNPRVETTEAAFAECRAFAPDLLLAIGGGSAIDVAKGVLDLWLREAPDTAPLLAAVPTTAGTGSEATRFAVLYKDGKKLSLDRPELRPAIALLDPALTSSLPPYTTACSGLDAIAQAIEALWAVRSTPESDAFAEKALSLLLPALPAAVKTGDATARAAMLRGANLSGRAIDITRTTAAHAFSYAFTSALHIPHGYAVWLTLPDVALYNAAVTDADCQDPRGATFVRERIDRIARRVAGEASPAALAATLRTLAADIGVELDPFRLGVADKMELRRLFSEANPARMANNPRALHLDDWMALWPGFPSRSAASERIPSPQEEKVLP